MPGSSHTISPWVLMPTEFGAVQIAAVRDSNGVEHAALLFGTAKNDLLVRIHSECLTGDVFHSRKCDCGEQLSAAIQLICDEGNGLICYLKQEGRGIGLFDKLRAYSLQQDGHDTVTANVFLGHAIDKRSYDSAAFMINNLGINRIRLITNNPHKVDCIEASGLIVSERIPLLVEANLYNEKYLRTKRDKMGHFLVDHEGKSDAH